MTGQISDCRYYVRQVSRTTTDMHKIHINTFAKISKIMTGVIPGHSIPITSGVSRGGQ